MEFRIVGDTVHFDVHDNIKHTIDNLTHQVINSARRNGATRAVSHVAFGARSIIGAATGVPLGLIHGICWHALIFFLSMALLGSNSRLMRRTLQVLSMGLGTHSMFLLGSLLQVLNLCLLLRNTNVRRQFLIYVLGLLSLRHGPGPNGFCFSDWAYPF